MRISRYSPFKHETLQEYLDTLVRCKNETEPLDEQEVEQIAGFLIKENDDLDFAYDADNTLLNLIVNYLIDNDDLANAGQKILQYIQQSAINYFDDKAHELFRDACVNYYQAKGLTTERYSDNGEIYWCAK